MEEELVELRRKLAAQQSPDDGSMPLAKRNGVGIASTPSVIQDHSESQDAIASLIDLRMGVDGIKEARARKLEDIFLSGDRLQELFDMYEFIFRSKLIGLHWIDFSSTIARTNH
jgi:hypothetical protein